LAAQELEEELGGKFCFLEGASGSTHNLTLSCDQAAQQIKETVFHALAAAGPRPVTRLAALKRRFKFKVRKFDEAREDEAVCRYCRTYDPNGADTTIQIFRDMRHTLAPQR